MSTHMERNDPWKHALEALKTLSVQDTETVRKYICLAIVDRERWVVFMFVFKDDPDMRRRLVDIFLNIEFNIG
jgi:hypothetical protein